MKILLMGDASNYHFTLGQGLSAMGHDVTVASDGSRWMDTGRTIDLSRRPGLLGGALLWVRLSTVLASRLKGYDVVQICGPIFVEQRPNRVMTLFRRLKRDNGAVFLTSLATDSAYVEMCTADDNPLAYSEWRVGNQPTDYALSPRGQLMSRWIVNPLSDHSRRIYDSVDGVVTALYEYHLAMKRRIEPERLAYGGIPIDTEAIDFVGAGQHNGPVRVFAPYHAGRELEKGTHRLYEAVKNTPGIEIQRITGLPFAQFVSQLRRADVVLDQLYSYTPATTAMMAMAMGKVVVTGAEPDFEAFIGGQHVPAINPDPRCLGALAGNLADVIDSAQMDALGRQARDFVIRNNDKSVVARRFVDFWNTRL